MDFGDVLVFILVGLGVLSQLFAGKKKHQAQKSPPRPTPRVPAGTSASTVPKQRAASYMERILKELELDDLVEQAKRETEAPVSIRSAPSPPPVRRQPLKPPTEIAAAAEEARRPLPEPGGQSLESLQPSGEAEHERFHELYIKPLRPGQVAHVSARVRKLINHNSLREAIVLKEIIGPPKALE
jgi:hypothetical protein